MLEPRDLIQFQSLGMTLPAIERQLINFQKGFPFVNLSRPATPGDGIIVFTKTQVNEYEHVFDSKIAGERVIKFVPASGAASRMFKKLFEFRDLYRNNPDKAKQEIHDTSFNSPGYLFSGMERIAFFNALNSIAAGYGTSVTGMMQNGRFGDLVGLILDPKGLNYSNLPKGLILFHDYPEGARTAAEEHLVEAVSYARDDKGVARIHFTISPEHRQKFDALFSGIQKEFERNYNTRMEVSLSYQEPSTDTIAVDENNEPFRNADGSLLFRPGGHGALIGNLNRLDADMVFIKNIDNIVPDRLKPETYRYKKVIGGYLLEMKERVFGFLRKADQGEISEVEIAEMSEFCRNKMSIILPVDFIKQPWQEQLQTLRKLLDRPMRVCGMVKNEGEPGGGPFWVRDTKGRVSLQIIESSQIDQDDPGQRAIMNASTHFNPVDLVCYIRDYRGKPFNLSEFIDEDTGFISIKSSGGRNLKAQELPGLWNGAMADWITVFAEVPVITFNPVKTVNDLLRPEHLPS
jgi:hypothetical protein